jgi:hypothetical protein
MKAIQPNIKQKLVFFFDRRFTYQMGYFYGLDIPVNGLEGRNLLRLGSDNALREEDKLDCGNPEDNEKIWRRLVDPILRKEMAINIEEPIKHPISDEYLDDSTSVVESKRSERVSDSQESQCNAMLQRGLTTKAFSKRVSRSTPSEISELTMITKQALGAEVLEVPRTDPSGPRSLDYEADTSDAEDNAGVQTTNSSSQVDSVMVGVAELTDVSLG